MKDNIHPNYQAATVTCRLRQLVRDPQYQAEDQRSRSARSAIRSIPGSQKFVDAAGRVDKFNKKFQGTYGKNKKVAAPEPAPTQA